MIRCQCRTKSGDQCSRKAKSPTPYCYQHQNCVNPVTGAAPPATEKLTTKTPITKRVTKCVTKRVAKRITQAAPKRVKTPVAASETNSTKKKEGEKDETPHAMAFAQAPILEQMILNIYDADEIEALCQADKRIRQACKDSGTIRAHMRRVKSCEIQREGWEILDSLSMTLSDEELEDVLGIFDEDRQDFVGLSDEQLDTPVAYCAKVKLDLVPYDWIELGEEIGEKTVTVQAANGLFIRVEDILKAFIDNNKQLKDAAGGSLGGHAHYEGISEVAPGHFAMLEYGYGS